MKVETRTGDPRDLTLLDVNARYMTHEQYQRLVANIRKDGALTSAPFVHHYDGRRVVLSGNHRVKAALEVGLQEITWFETSDPLSKAEQVAIQLSHNAIAGQDDPAVLAQLYSEIEDLDLRAYSGLDDKTLELLADVSIDKLQEANLDYQMLHFTFLPADMDRARNGFAEAEDLSRTADERWLGRYEDHFRLLDAISTAGKANDIRNQAAGLAYVLDVFENHRTDLQAGWYDPDSDLARHERWIPLSSIFGVDDIPPAAAVKVAKAVEKMVGCGDVTTKSRWLALEAWADAYLDA